MKKTFLVLFVGMLLLTLLSAVHASADNQITRGGTVGAYKQDECDNCLGGGTITQSSTCSRCSGSGTVKTSCATCGGDGENGYTSGTRTCSTCKGTGRATKTNYTQTTCSSCSGVGKYRRCGICGRTLSSYQSKCSYCTYGVTETIYCSSCNGSGTRYVATGTTTVTCPTCSGNGLEQTSVPKKCTSCSGNGKVDSDCSKCTSGSINTSITCTICSGSGFKAYMVGDIDGRSGVTDADAVHLFRHTLSPDNYSLNQNCDFNGDGRVNDKDAAYLLYYTFLPDLYPIS